MRSRNIKPGFFTNETLVDLPALTRLLYIGLWCVADRRGLVADRPRKLKMEILPADDINVDEALASLAETGHIVRYVGDNGTKTICIINFCKHQKPHHKEANNESLVERTQVRASTDLGACQPALIPDSGFLIPDSGLLIPDCSPPESGTASLVLALPSPVAIPTREGDEPIQQQEVDTWADLYGNVDVLDLLRRMRGHWLSKPANQRKTRKGVRTSINTWLAREHDRSRPQGARASPQMGVDGRADRTRAAMNEVLNELRGGENGKRN
jgi:hypothetical protein